MLELISTDKSLIEEAERIDTASIIDEILMISRASWEKQIDQVQLDAWLSNFSGKALGSPSAERNLALWLLSGLVYFNIDDVRLFCKNLFNEFIHSKLVEYRRDGKHQDISIDKQIKYVLDSSLFLALGNDSESGANVLYYFRQINKLSKDVFDKKPDAKYENLVFVDDVSISGTQALTYISQMKSLLSCEKTYYLTFLASEDAIDEMQHISVETIFCNRLTDRERCFSTNSYVFSSASKRRFLPLAAKMCEYYGEIITAGHPEADGYPLGFDQGQCLFCFFYNTPDNTLPIFWCSGNGWHPLFSRYEKIGELKEAPIHESKYV